MTDEQPGVESAGESFETGPVSTPEPTPNPPEGPPGSEPEGPPNTGEDPVEVPDPDQTTDDEE